jgi:hypothetical protein
VSLREQIAEIIKQSGHQQNEYTKANSILQLIQSHAKEQGWLKIEIITPAAIDYDTDKPFPPYRHYVPLTDKDFK